MAAPRKLAFKSLYINGHMVDGDVNECQVSQLDGRQRFSLILKEDVLLEVDIQDSIVQFNHSGWDPEPNASLILDLKITLKSIPPWMELHSNALTGCLHWISLTMVVEGSKSNYSDFINKIRSMLSITQCSSLEKDKASVLWKERSAARSNCKVESIKFIPPNFGQFRRVDLVRLREDHRWLSDAHVTLALLKVWGTLEIKLLDTTMWQKLSKEPESYTDRFRRKHNLLEADFLVMPMFNKNHWRLGIVENPGGFLQGHTVFHILDSLRENSVCKNETKQLQNILLMHFDDETFEDGRITTNVPVVPRQPNEKDCACFVIFFGKKFFHNPDATLAVIKSQFSSDADRLAAWGLKNTDLTFVRRDLRTTLLQYINREDAVVEYKQSLLV